MPPAKTPRRLEYMPLDEITPALVNAKDHDEALISASVARFGLIESIVMDERTGRLVAGHGRLGELVRARDAGEEPPDGVVVNRDGTWTAPVQRGWASLNDDEAHAAGVALNQATIAGGMREDVLADLLDGVRQRTDAGLTGTGFAEDVLAGLLARKAKMGDGVADFLNDAIGSNDAAAGAGDAPPLIKPPADIVTLSFTYTIPDRDEIQRGLKMARDHFGRNTSADALLELVRAWVAQTLAS